MSYQIGLITEDISDFDVVDEIIRKLVPKSKYSIKKYVGHGCGKIIGKCRDWAIDLKRRNCSILIILHDLDNQTETLLYKRLNQAMSPSPISKFVLVIPVQEIEAWLLSDLDAIKKALNLQATLPKIPNPESILNPKEHLGQMV